MVIGGDINADLTDSRDVYGSIITEELLETTGWHMVVENATHQGIRKGKSCKARIIDHVYTNCHEKLKNLREISYQGSHHKLLRFDFIKRIKYLKPKQMRTRVKKNYSKKAILEELDKHDWNVEDWENKSFREKIFILESAVDKFNHNIQTSLDKIAPIKMINMRKEREPWT